MYSRSLSNIHRLHCPDILSKVINTHMSITIVWYSAPFLITEVPNPDSKESNSAVCNHIQEHERSGSNSQKPSWARIAKQHFDLGPHVYSPYTLQKWLWSRFRMTQQHFTHLLHNTRKPHGKHPSHLLPVPVRMLTDHTHSKKKLLQERVLAEKWWQVPEQSCYNTTGYVSSLRLTSWQDCHISGSTHFSMPSRQNRHKYLIYNFMNSLKTRSYLLLFLSLSGCYSLALLLCKVYYFPQKLKHNTLNHSCSY